jgi:hypothetical protein
MFTCLLKFGDPFSKVDHENMRSWEVVISSASGTGDRGFESRQDITKRIKRNTFLPTLYTYVDENAVR